MSDDHLTVLDQRFESQRARTVPGMAHWAGSGPKRKVCGECAFYTTISVGLGNSPRCGKYAELMRGKFGTKRLPENTPACKYFEQAEKA